MTRGADTLVERSGQLEQIRNTLGTAAAGDGRLLVLEGDAGAGKTSLLEAAADQATSLGFRVLQARCTEFESDYAFGAVRQWLGPVLRTSTPARQAELLEDPAIAAMWSRHPSATAPAFAALESLNWLLADLADAQPLLLVIDDAQWADTDTRRLLAFIAPRLGALPIALLLAARTGELNAPDLAGLTTSRPLTDVLEVPPLSPEAVADLVADRLGPVPSLLALACHEVTGGNAFLVLALVDELSRSGLDLTGDIADRVRTLGPKSVANVALARISSLSDAAPSVAQALSVLGDGATSAELAAVLDLAEAQLTGVLHELERAGLLSPDRHLRFAHAIIRNAVHGDLTQATRTALHRRAAAVLSARGAAAERVAAHLFATEDELDAAGVAVLRAAGADAMRRGAPHTATSYLRSALQSSPPGPDRLGVLVALAEAEMLVDGPASIDHLRDALAAATTAGQRVPLGATLAKVLIFAGQSRAAVEMAAATVREAEAIGDIDGVHHLEALQLAATRVDPSLVDVRESLLSLVKERGLVGDGFGAKALTAGLAMHQARALQINAVEAVAQVTWALDGGELLGRGNGDADFIGASIAVTAADSPLAITMLDAGLADAISRGDVFARAACSIFRCHAHARRGELKDAIAIGEAGLADSDAFGIAIGHAWGGGYLAGAYAAAGDLAATERTLSRAHPAGAPSGDVPDQAHWHPYLDARAEFLLLSGDPTAAFEASVDAGQRFAAFDGRNPAYLPWRSRAARCLLALDADPDRARELVTSELEDARTWGTPHAIGAALRVLGLVDNDAATLLESVSLLETSPARLELARALGDLGAMQRRTGEGLAARATLERGLHLARRCGAAALAQGIAEELAAAGGRPGRAMALGVDALTPSELRVARLAVSGLSNRDIAHRLFVTVKTVEFHLGQVYRKLDIAGRADLSRHLG